MNVVESPIIPAPHGLQWMRVVLRAVGMAVGSFVLVSLYIVFYWIEKILPRLKVTDLIAYLWGRMGVFLCGLKFEVVGEHMKHGGALVANHVSWLDIFTFHCAARISYVAKAEVRRWPVVGFMANVTGTLFIERRAALAKQHQAALLERLDNGDQLCFFPEGTSTDGRGVKAFKSTLFSAFHTPEMIDHVWVQPATVTYFAPAGEAADFYGWWGDMGFAEHILSIIGRSSGGRVRVTLHDPVKASDFTTRKELAQYCERVVREGLAEDLGVSIAEVTQ